LNQSIFSLTDHVYLFYFPVLAYMFELKPFFNLYFRIFGIYIIIYLKHELRRDTVRL